MGDAPDSHRGAAHTRGLYRRTSSRAARYFAHEALEPRRLLAATLVADINIDTLGSRPSAAVEHGGAAYFGNDSDRESAAAPVGGALYRTDGTSAGTALLLPLGLDARQPDHFLSAGGLLYFTASSAIGTRRVWRTDGTAAGTFPVARVADAPRMYSFPATPNGSTSGLAAVGGTVFFAAPGAAGSLDLWKTDGTPGGTALVKSAVGPSLSMRVLEPGFSAHALGGALYFAGAGGLWRSDGTAEGTVLLKAFSATNAFLDANPKWFTSLGDRLYFAGLQSGQGRELWQTDGTIEGTVLVKDINPGSSDANVAELTTFNGSLFFSATAVGVGRELWRSDGTATGTVPVTEIVSGTGSSSPDRLTVVGDRLMFFASDGSHGRELWTSDGSGIL